MSAWNKLNFQKFSASNGLLRIIILITSLMVLGLTAGDFNPISLEIYLLVVVVLCLLLTICGIFFSLLDGFDHGLVFKTVDYTTHLYGAWFLFNSSLAKLICASRFSISDAEAAVRVLSGVFGLMNSGLFGWLAYLTAAEKQGFPCRFSKDVRNIEVDEGIKIKSRPRGQQPQVLFKSSDKMTNLDSWSWERSLTWERISERLEWNNIFDGGSNQARLFTLATGIVNLIFIAQSYIRFELNEEYFLTVVSINMVLTLMLHAAYLSGLSSFIYEDMRIFDKSFHLTGGLFLFIGAVLMLGSTISKSSLPTIHDRTFASIFGILNGVLYIYIGMKEKNKEFQDSSSVAANDQVVNGVSPTFMMATERDREDGFREKEKMMTKQNIMYPQRMRPSLIFDPSKL